MPRFERILFPVDFSERSRAAAPFVRSMARRCGSKVMALHALEPLPPVYDGTNMVYPEAYDFEGLSADLRAELGKFVDAELPGMDAAGVVEMGDPAAVITEFAQKHNIDLIMMPTHGYGAFRRALLGSVTAKVLHDAKVPVWTDAHAPEASRQTNPQPGQILCAVDLKPHSRVTLELATEVAAGPGASIAFVHISPRDQDSAAESKSRLQELLAGTAADDLEKTQQNAGATRVELVVTGSSIADQIRDAAIARHADLVVIGRGCRHGPGSLWSHAYDIIREAPCPVLSAP